jgi:thiamine-phosphate pyrophosphorylase
MTFAIDQRRLYGILDLGYVRPEDSLRVARTMLEGGVQVLQLRAKNLPPEQIPPLAIPLVTLCQEFRVPFLLNDHPQLVPETGADGVHVGQDDMPVAAARVLAGPGKLVGLSTHSLAQATAALAQAPDYIGFGPLFSTLTKPDYPPIGLADIASVHAKVGLPIFCIGGINLPNLPNVLAAGAKRVVIVSGILQAPDIKKYCSACVHLLRPAPEG